MKIGQFSKKHGVTIDTVRHYMDLGLIIPKKVGGHFRFDSSCEEDLNQVLRLKRLGFALEEIQKIFSYKRLTGLKTVKDREVYKGFLCNKKKEMTEELQRINNIISELDQLIKQREPEVLNKDVKLGLPLGFLDFLGCPSCGNPVNLSSGQIQDGMVMEGCFSCSCGQKMPVQDGILVNASQNRVICQQEYLKSDAIKDYVQKTAPQFVNFIYRAIEWILRKTRLSDSYYKAILELGTGSGFFLIKALDSLHPDSFYIVTDVVLERVMEIKYYLESNSEHRRFVFVCSDFLDLPVKRGAVDLVIDYLGSTCCNFEREGYLIEKLDSFVRAGGIWAGCYYYMEPGAKSLSQCPPECRVHFYKPNIVEFLKRSNFQMLEMEELGSVNQAGEYEPFFIEGDELYQLVYLGRKRWG